MKTKPIILAAMISMLIPVTGSCKDHMEKQKKEESSQMEQLKEKMIRKLQEYGISDQKVLEAMKKVRRHRFIPSTHETPLAYGDHPLPIGYNQTISQPFIVAYMTEKMQIAPGEKVLEIGTGSGYQAGILAELGANVYSIEIIPELASHAAKVLKEEGYDVKVKCDDGFNGWEEHAPFSIIIVTCAPEHLPEKLLEQLQDKGRMILPLGDSNTQRLIIVRKSGEEMIVEQDLPVRFVPMVKEKR